MANERVILCGGLTAPGGASKKSPVSLSLWGPQSNVTLKVTDISEKMVANIPPVLVDLLEIATYVYCADQATTRGDVTDRDYGGRWRRKFRFHIPVREPDLWSSDPVCTVLRDTLAFLSDDEYEFTFKKLAKPPPMDRYLDFGAGGASVFEAEEVLLFSGGLDSLGGAIQEAVVEKRSAALVSHRSSPKIFSRQKALLEDLRGYCTDKRPFHVPVWVHKDKALSREYTQRTRSFLYASLGAVVARISDLWRIRFYENGIVSINLPISPQVVGGRATRTTHPQVLNGFAELFSAIFEKPFAVENPFSWMTKTQVVQSVRDAGCGDLIKRTMSCTHVWAMTKLKTHCGVCSQCLDRRFATLSAGCPDAEDPEEMYGVDLLRGERAPGESRTMLESYVGTARRVKGMSNTAFFTEFGEVHRVIRNIRNMKVDDAASRILEMYKRHATEVCDVIAKGIQDHAHDLTEGTLPSTCLIILALPDQYKRSTPPAEPLPEPAPVFDKAKDGGANRFSLTGEYWSVTYKGRTKTFSNTKGLRYIVWLIRNQGKEILVSDLYYAINPPDSSTTDSIHSGMATSQLEEIGFSVDDLGNAGDALTPEGKNRIDQAVRAIQEQIEEANEFGDDEKAAKLEQKQEEILSHLAAKTGLGGKPRKASSAIERMRKAVTKRIRDDIKKITTTFPDLGHHLNETVRTGTQCQYSPHPPVEWSLDP